MEEDNTTVVPSESIQTQPLQEQPAAEEAVETHDATDEQDVETEEAAPVTNESEPSEATVVEEDDDDFTPDFQAPPAPPAVDINAFVDEQGQIDLAAYNRAQADNQAAIIASAVAQATNQMQLRRDYEKTWDKAYDKFPALKGDKKLRDMVQAIHANSATPGAKYLSPTKAAEQLFSYMGEVKTQATNTARETRTVQAAAQLAVSNPPSQISSDRATNLKESMKNGATIEERKAGSLGYIEEMIKAGKL